MAKKPPECECEKAKSMAKCSALKDLVKQMKLLPGDKIFPRKDTTTAYWVVRQDGTENLVEIPPKIVTLIVSSTICCLTNNEKSCQKCQMEGGPLCLWQYTSLSRTKSCLQ